MHAAMHAGRRRFAQRGLQRRRVRSRGVRVRVDPHTSSTQPATQPGDDRTFELMWTCVDGTFIGALYHPPRSSYTTDSLLDYIELCV